MIEPMTKQELWDATIAHLREQGSPSLNENDQCCYRGADGKSCAIGCHIPDNEYSDVLESVTIKDMIRNTNYFGDQRAAFWYQHNMPETKKKFENINILFLQELQNLHDVWFGKEIAYEASAKKLGVKYTPCE